MIRVQQIGKALNSEIVLTLIVRDEAQAKSTFQLLWSTINSFEKRFSRFLPDSELSSFNASAGKPTKISPEFRKLVLSSQKFSKLTNGLYNPLVLPALQKAGYVGSWPEPSKFVDQLNYSKRQVFSYDAIKVEPESAAIPANSALDFGGIGKGYLLDQLAELLEKNAIKSYWLYLGGDIICAGFDHEKQAWKVSIADASDEEVVTETLLNKSGSRMSVATSGVVKRKGEGWHHIIDPRTGLPADTDVLTATIVNASGTAADIYAKSLIILGSKIAEAFTVEKKSYAIVQTLANSGARALHYGSKS